MKDFIKRRINDLNKEKEEYIKSLQENMLKTMELKMVTNVKNALKLELYNELLNSSLESKEEMMEFVKSKIISLSLNKSYCSNEGRNFVESQTPFAYGEVLDALNSAFVF